MEVSLTKLYGPGNGKEWRPFTDALEYGCVYGTHDKSRLECLTSLMVCAEWTALGLA